MTGLIKYIGGKKWIPFLILLLAASASASDFSFVVIGDTRPPIRTSSYANFTRQINHINSFDPSFIINCGDFIFGYGGAENESAWSDYRKIIAAIKIPYHQLPGNHDIFSEKAQAIYKELFHNTYYSFNYDGCHFILLDNAENAIWGYISDQQLQWLKRDIETEKQKTTFVFMHLPIWWKGQTQVDNQYYEFWKNELHPLFCRYHVKAVFGGHIHSYGPTQHIDGIDYFITGGGGAELNKWYQDHGGDFHFMLIHMNGDKMTHSIVTESEVLTEDEADVAKNIDFAKQNVGQMIINMEKAASTKNESFSITLTNPSHKIMTGSARWKFDKHFFKLDPEEAAIRIAPGKTETYAFNVMMLNDRFYAAPMPSLAFSLQHDNSRIVFNKDLIFHRELAIPRINYAITIDGNLGEWNLTEPVVLRDEKNNRAIAEILTAYDDNRLYIGARVYDQNFSNDYDDSMIFMNDSLLIALDRTLKRMQNGNDDLQLEISRTKNGLTLYNRAKGERINAEASGIKAAVANLDTGIIVYEMALPKAFLSPLALTAGTKFGINFGVCNAGDKGKTELATWTPGIEIEGVDDSFRSQLNFAGAELIPSPNQR